MSRDGMSVVYVAPTTGEGSVVYVQALAKGASLASKPILGASGKPDRLGGCDWVSNQRLVCVVYGVVARAALPEPVEGSRLIPINTHGTKMPLLSSRDSYFQIRRAHL